MKRLHFILILFISLILSCSKVVKKDGQESIIYLRNGEEIRCEILKIDQSKIIYVENGKVKKINKRDVSSIDFVKSRPGDHWKKWKDVDDKTLLSYINQDLSEFERYGFVTLLLQKKYSYMEGKWVYTERRIMAVFDERGKGESNRYFFYLAPTDRAELIYARTLLKDSSVVSVRESAIDHVNVFASIPFYNQLKMLKFAIPQAEPGAIMDYMVKIEYRRPPEYFLISETVGEKFPVRKETIEIDVPEDIELNIKGDRKPILLHVDSRKVYKWDFSDVEGIPREPQAPPSGFYFLPKIYAAIDSGRWEEIAERFREDMKKKLAYLQDFKGKRKKDIYYTILKNIKTVEIERNLSSFELRRVEDIEKSRFANDFDKAFYLYAALKSAGYEPRFILVLSKEQGPLPEKVPQLESFSSALVKIDDIYLDPYRDITPYGYVRSQFQGTIGLNVDTGELEEIPWRDEGTYTSITGELKENGDLNVSIIVKFRGEDAISMRTLKELPEKQIKSSVENYMRKILPRATLKRYEILNMESPDKDFILRMDCEVKSFAREAGDYIIMKLPGIHHSASNVSLEKRKTPMFYGKRFENITELNIKLPKDYWVYYIPPDLRRKIDMAKYTSFLRIKRNTILYFREKFSMGSDLIPVEKYPSFRNFIEEIARWSDDRVILKR